MKKQFEFNLLVNSVIFIFLVKIFFFLQRGFGNFLLYFFSFVQDSIVIMLNYALFVLLRKKFKKTSKWIYYIIQIIILIISLIYTKFIEDIIKYPINIFGVNLEISQFFINNFLNFGYELLIVFFIAFIFFFSGKFDWKIGKKVKIISVIIFILLFVFSLGKPVINPLVYSVWEEANNKINPSPYRGEIERISNVNINLSYNARDFSFIDKRLTKSTENIKYDKIIVLAMESVNENYFKSYYGGRKILNKTSCKIYDNYHTTNLDSYTSLIAMLDSFLVPYKAYSNEVNYTIMERNNNLVRFFNENGYGTSFISTYDINPYIPNKEDWRDIIERKDFDEKGYLCLDISKIDSACEDKIAIDRIIDLLKNNKKEFILQEMVYGHLSDWKDKTGIGQIEYYDSFFNELYDKLEKEKLLNETLIVIVSDHGPRTDAFNIENYQIPLALCGDDIKESRNGEFSSHIDFNEIMLNAISGRNISRKDKIYTIGSSNEWVYGEITSNSSWVFINNRNLNVKTDMNKEEVISFGKDFQRYLSYFEGEIVNPGKAG